MTARAWLGGLGTAVAAVLLTGCQSGGCGHGRPSVAGKSNIRAAMPGVVEIYRNSPNGYKLVGYASLDPGFPEQASWWLLNGDEIAPVTPDAYDVKCVMNRDYPNYMSGPEMCDHFGAGLTAPEIWFSSNDDQMLCTPHVVPNR